MICYIKDSKNSEQKKAELQAQHEFHLEKLLKDNDFKGEVIDKIMPNKNGITKLYDENERIGNVYGLHNDIVTANVLNLTPIVGTAKIYSYLDDIENPEYKDLASKLQQYRFDFDIVETKDSIANIENDIFIDPSINDFEKRLLQAILVRIEPSLLNFGATPINRIKSTLKGIGLVETKVIDELFKDDSLKENIKKVNEDLEIQIGYFLSHFGVKIHEYESLKEVIGIDTLGFTDVLNKTIWIAKNRNLDVLSEEASHIILMLMGDNNDTLNTLLDNIHRWDKYKDISKKYEPLYNNIKQVKLHAVALLLKESFVNKARVFEIQELSLVDKLKKEISKFSKSLISFFYTDNKLPLGEVYELADIIVNNVLNGKVDFISSVVPKFEKLNSEKALAQNAFAQKIIDVMRSHNAALTGSLAIAMQGETIFRNSDDPIHDLDFKISEKNYEKVKEIVKNDLKGIDLHDAWAGDNGLITYSYAVPLEGFSIVLRPEHLRKGTFDNYYDVLDSDEKIVEKSHKNNLLMDFFVSKNKEITYPNNIASYDDIYLGKLSLTSLKSSERLFKRKKDLSDYIHFRPNAQLAPKKEFLYYTEQKSVPKYSSDKQIKINPTKEESEFITEQNTIEQSKIIDTIPQSNEALNEILISRLKEHFPDFKLEYLKLNIEGHNGVVDFSNKLIQLQIGNQPAITEEMAHVFLEHHKDRDKLIRLVVGTKIFADTFSEYKEVYGWDIEKIKREAAAKLLAQTIYAQNTGDYTTFNEWTTKNVDARKKLLAQIKQYIKDLFIYLLQTDMSLYQDVAKQILRNDIKREVFSQQQLSSLGKYYQLSQDELRSKELSDSLINLIDPALQKDEVNPIVQKLEDAKKIIDSNFELFLQNEFRNKIFLPKDNIAKSINISNSFIKGISQKHENLAAIAGSYITLFDSVGRMAKTITNTIQDKDLTPRQLSTIKHVLKQWQYYLTTFEESADYQLGGIEPLFLDTKNSLSRAEDVLYNRYKDISANILFNELKPVFDTIISQDKESLKKISPLFEDGVVNELVLILKKKSISSNELTLSDFNLSNNKEKILALLNLGHLKNRAAVKHIDNIVNKTINERDVTNIILSRDTAYGDVSMVGNIFLPAASRDDLIIPSIQKIIDRAKIEAQSNAIQINSLLEQSVKPFLKNIKISNTDLGRLITIDSKRKYKGKHVETLSLMTDFNQDVFVELEKLLDDRNKEDKNSKEWRAKNNEYRKYKIDNFYSDLTDEATDLLDINYTEEINGIVYDVGHEYKTRIDAIFDEIKSLSEEIESMPITIENQSLIDSIELNINAKQNEINMFSQLKQNGVEKTGLDLAIAKFIKTKRDAYNKVYSSKPNLSKLLTTWNKYYANIVQPSNADSNLYKDFNNGIQRIIQNIQKSDKEKLYDIYVLYTTLSETAKLQKIEYKFLKKWFIKNIKISNGKDFYKERERIIQEINKLKKENIIIAYLEDDNNIEKAEEYAKNYLENESTSKAWHEISDIEISHKDEERIIVGTSLSQAEKATVKKLQEKIEKEKHEKDTIYSKSLQFNVNKSKISDLYNQLGSMQESNVTDYYIESVAQFSSSPEQTNEFYDKLTTHVETYKVDTNDIDNPNLLREENDGTSQALISRAAETLGIKNTDDFNQFSEWFKENHYIKYTNISVDGEVILVPYYAPIHAWMRVKNKDTKNMEIKLNTRHSERTINAEYLTKSTFEKNGIKYETKDDFGRWKPKLFDKKGNNLHINTIYEELKKDVNAFEVLKSLTKIHVKNQIENDRLLKNKLFYVIPQMNKEYFEDSSKFDAKRIIESHTTKSQQYGEDNFEETDIDLTIGERAKKIKDKILGSLFAPSKKAQRVDFQGDKIVTVALGHYNHIDKSMLSTDIVKSIMASTESYATHKAFNGINPQIDILRETLKRFNKAPDRLQAVEDIVDTEISGINQLFEVTRTGHGLIGRLKWMAAVKSQSILNLKGALKNFFAGVGNTWLNKDLISDYGLNNAIADWSSQYVDIKKGFLGETKSKEFKIFEFFLPETKGKFKYYLNDKLKRQFLNGKFFYSAQEEGEINIMGVTLQLFLNRKYKNGVIKDYIDVENDENGMSRVVLKESTQDDLNNMKLMFTQLMRTSQGNQGWQKAVTKINTSTIGSAIMMFRSFLPGLLLNHFEYKNRIDLYLQKDVRGFYAEGAFFAKELYDHISGEGVNIEGMRRFWAETTDAQKQALLKIAKQALMIAATKIIVSFFFNDDDEDRYEKLRDRPFILNVLLYELIAVKQEVTGWSPLSPLDLLNEGSSSIVKTSIAFEELKKIGSLVNALWNLLWDDEDAYVKKSTPFADKGDIKFFADLSKVLGRYNAEAMFDNEKFIHQIKDFANILDKN